jgi:hypothetical protein
LIMIKYYNSKKTLSTKLKFCSMVLNILVKYKMLSNME